MALPRFYRHTITVVSPGEKTVLGAKTEDWSDTAVTKREIKRCWARSASAEELRDRGRDTDIDAFKVDIPADADPPESRDRVIMPNGGEYEVMGPVQFLPSGTGRLDFQMFMAERIVNRG